MSYSHHSHHHNPEPEFQSNTQARIGKFPGTLKSIDVPEGAAVADILAVAELSEEGYDLRLNGSPASLKDRVSPGDTVYLVKPIRGN